MTNGEVWNSQHEHLMFSHMGKQQEIITLWCGGCCFSEDAIKVRIYNPVLTLYFLNYYIPHKEVPYQMVDGNVYSDYAGLRHFIRTNRLSGMYASIMEEVVGNGMISAGIDIGYPVESLVWPDNFKSLLYYFGLLFPHVAVVLYNRSPSPGKPSENFSHALRLR